MATRTKKTSKKKEKSIEQLRKEALKEIAAMDTDDEKTEPKPATAKKKGRTNHASKPMTKAKPVKAPKARKVSLIDAAVTILTDAKAPMTCKDIVEAVQAKGLWSPAKGGLTPHATLYSAVLREIQKRKKEARFVKVERGRFELKASKVQREAARHD